MSLRAVVSIYIGNMITYTRLILYLGRTWALVQVHSIAADPECGYRFFVDAKHERYREVDGHQEWERLTDRCSMLQRTWGGVCVCFPQQRRRYYGVHNLTTGESRKPCTFKRVGRESGPWLAAGWWLGAWPATHLSTFQLEKSQFGSPKPGT